MGDDHLVIAYITISTLNLIYDNLLKLASEKKASYLDPLFWKQESNTLKNVLESHLKFVFFVKGAGLLDISILSILFFSAIFLNPYFNGCSNSASSMQSKLMLDPNGTKNSQPSYCPATAVSYQIWSQIPLGAGLGSSASFGVALIAAIFSLLPEENNDNLNIYYWSNVSETIIHGTSSGLDPLVSILGNSICFTKNKEVSNSPFSSPTLKAIPKLISESDFNVFPFVLDYNSFSLAVLYSGLPRKTSDMVTRVKNFKTLDETSFATVIDKIETISKEAFSMFLTKTENTFFSVFSSLISKNQLLLSQPNPNGLDVDSIEFNVLRNKIEASGIFPIPVTFASKITGAGGGGCAIYLFPNEMYRELFISQVTEAKLLSKPYPLLFPVEIDPRGSVITKLIG